ncbi:ribokinase [Blastopirellula sp. JC732]|uniref:Ribokinase n=1 Tax=Blastopirellula sediminis TaxID=2894196 RepID=A0A9X1MK13_9BACT|nr:ribokinase [Blastopirellula sediminis]MCC9608645.1 ribokinase [Blastopirellula sediminis]MCC9628578.1 ribokinase [Blastopirellula sediminis]
MRDTLAPPRVVVVGSINMDLVVRCAHFPQPGETIAARSLQEVSGGKGANQAVSAACAGGNVSMIGRVGDDAFGGRLIQGLKNFGVNCDSVQPTANCESGLALISVEDSGQNAIMIVAGANGRLSADDIETFRQLIQTSDAVLLQLETPLATVLRVIEIARECETRVILDPAPAPTVCPDELLQVDLICPNEQEAAQLSGLPVESLEQIELAARSLYQRGARHVVITLGAQGAYLYDDQGGRLIPAFATTVVDTTAAGDAFVGALAIRWIETDDLEEAIRFGNAAGSIAATRLGAQPSMGSRTEIEQLWKSLT